MQCEHCFQRTSVTKGNMRVNGTIVGLDYTLKNGDLIEHHIHRYRYTMPASTGSHLFSFFPLLRPSIALVQPHWMTGHKTPTYLLTFSLSLHHHQALLLISITWWPHMIVLISAWWCSLWWSLCRLYLHACQVRVTVGDSGLCCCTCVNYLKRATQVFVVVLVLRISSAN